MTIFIYFYETYTKILGILETYTRDYFDYGLISKCPNCNSRTILSFPTTQCTKCKNRFKNDIIVVSIHTKYSHGCGKINIAQYGISDKLVIR